MTLSSTCIHETHDTNVNVQNTFLEEAKDGFLCLCEQSKYVELDLNAENQKMYTKVGRGGAPGLPATPERHPNT